MPSQFSRESLSLSGRFVLVASAISFLLGFLLANRIAPESDRLIPNQEGGAPANRETDADAVRRSFRRTASPGEFRTPDSQSSPAQGIGNRFLEEERKAEIERSAKAAFLTQSSLERRTNYAPVLASLGLNPEQVEIVLKKLEVLHRGAMVAGDSMLDLLQERQEYQRELKGMLGDEGFAKYELFERAKPYRRELLAIREFAGQNWPALGAQTEAAVVQLLQKHQMYTTETWEGPFDFAPRPRVGSEAMLARISEYNTRLSTGLDNALQELSVILPEDATALVKSYFDGQLEQLDQKHKFFSLSEDERKRYLEERIREAKRVPRP